MLRKIQEAMRPSKDGLARAFVRLGWTGFWLQVLLGAIPVILMAYYFVFSRSTTGPRNGLPFVEYLTLANFAILVFTTLWALRYTRLGKRMLDPKTYPSESQITSVVWTGLVASTLGMLFSMLVMLIESGQLLFYFLKTPQAGVPVIQTTNADAASWVSAVDMASLVALNLTLMAELVVLVFSLWLLFRTTVNSQQPTADTI